MTLLLRVSLAANAVLGVLAVVLMWSDPRGSPAAGEPSGFARPAAVESRTASSATRHPVVEAAGEGGLSPDAWEQLAQMGVTRDLLASALLERFERGWDRRVQEVEKRFSPRPVPERVYVELGRQREEERTQELRAALGERAYQAWDRERTLERLNTTGVQLSQTEADRAYRLQQDFEEKHRELEMAIEDGVADRADGAALQRQAEEALAAELETLLGRERWQAMRGRGDPVSDVYQKYGDIGLTREQAELVVRQEEAHRTREEALHRRWQDSRADAVELEVELTALAQARDEGLREILGEAAYETHRRENDSTYRTLQQFAGAWGLAEQEVQSVYPTLRSLHDEVERTRQAAALREAAGQPVNWRDVDAAIDQARQQAEAGLRHVIGPERLRRLEQNGLLDAR